MREGIEVRNAMVGTVEIVFPVMVQALEGARCARGTASAGAQPVAAMLADIVETAHAAIRLPHDEDGFHADLGHDVVAGIRHVERASRDQPHLGPQALPLEPHEFGRRVAALIDDRVPQIGIRRFLVRRARQRAAAAVGPRLDPRHRRICR